MMTIINRETVSNPIELDCFLSVTDSKTVQKGVEKLFRKAGCSSAPFTNVPNRTEAIATFNKMKHPHGLNILVDSVYRLESAGTEEKLPNFVNVYDISQQLISDNPGDVFLYTRITKDTNAKAAGRRIDDLYEFAAGHNFGIAGLAIDRDPFNDFLKEMGEKVCDRIVVSHSFLDYGRTPNEIARRIGKGRNLYISNDEPDMVFFNYLSRQLMSDNPRIITFAEGSNKSLGQKLYERLFSDIKNQGLFGQIYTGDYEDKDKALVTLIREIRMKNLNYVIVPSFDAFGKDLNFLRCILRLCDIPIIAANGVVLRPVAVPEES